MHRTITQTLAVLAFAQTAAALKSDVVMTSLPKMRSRIGHGQPNNGNLAQLKSVKGGRQDPSAEVTGDNLASSAVASKMINHQWTDDIIDMTPVPFYGSEDADPHSEFLALDAVGTQLLDIPDIPRSGNAKRAKVQQQADLFAQIETSQQTEITHTCSSAHDRIKGDRVDFWGQNTLFTDETFAYDDALFWADQFSENFGKMAGMNDRITWVRAYNRFPDNLLWGYDGITPLDVRQGAIGNCWFMAAASALAEKPHRLEKVFLNEESALNPNGIYAINIYALGVPTTIIVDDYLPLQRYWEDAPYETLFSLVGEDTSMWGVLLEKAFAKIHGNYERLIAGDPRMAARTLMGAPSIQHVHRATETTVDFLWEELIRSDTSDEMMFLITPGTTDTAVNECGLANNHAYVVLGAAELSNGAKLVKMRNPWGRERYTCDYSDESELWTPALRQEAGATQVAVNEGVFFMKSEDFHEQGLATLIAYDTTDWANDHFLMLSDETDSPGSWSWCGETCTRHLVQVTSSVSQTVYVTAHTWDKRSYSEECRSTNKIHSIYMEGDFTVYTFREGARQMNGIEFVANEPKSFILEFDWARENVTKDWSVTAWAAGGSIEVSHSDGITSDTLPYIGEYREEREENSDPSGSTNGSTNHNSEFAPNQDDSAIVPPTDPKQIALNNFVDSFDIQTQEDHCGFRLREVMDEDLRQFMTVAAHNCDGYSVNLTLYMLPQDWQKIEYSYKEEDGAGNQVLGNEQISCGSYGPYGTCTYVLSTDNPRLGLLMESGSYGLMTYAAQWVRVPE